MSGLLMIEGGDNLLRFSEDFGIMNISIGVKVCENFCALAILVSNGLGYVMGNLAGSYYLFSASFGEQPPRTFIYKWQETERNDRRHGLPLNIKGQSGQ